MVVVRPFFDVILVPSATMRLLLLLLVAWRVFPGARLDVRIWALAHATLGAPRADAAGVLLVVAVNAATVGAFSVKAAQGSGRLGYIDGLVP